MKTGINTLQNWYKIYNFTLTGHSIVAIVYAVQNFIFRTKHFPIFHSSALLLRTKYVSKVNIAAWRRNEIISTLSNHVVGYSFLVPVIQKV